MSFNPYTGSIAKKLKSLPYNDEGLGFWRHKIYYFLSLALVIFGLIAYIPSLVLSVYEELWGVAILDTAVYALLLLLFFVKSIPFAIRVYALLFLIYALSVALLLLLGAMGAGLLWLFAFPVLASILKGFRCALLAVFVNFLTFLTLGVLLDKGMLEGFLMTTYSLEVWMIIGVNFLCLNLLVSIPIAVLINGLEVSINKEKKARDLLRQEQVVLSKRNKDLKRINNDLDNFVYTASHDLKAPISNIEGLMTLLQHELGEQNKPEVRETMDLILKSINRFQRTIRSLTEVSKAQQEETDSSFELLNLEDILQEVTFNISDLVKKNSPVFYFDLKVKEVRYIKKDLISILYNLLSNAVKYCSPTRACEVRVSTEAESDYWVLAVKDNGLGMRPDYKDKLFKIFRRLHDHVEGTGIGLYIVKRKVENYGGKIEVKSEQGKGSEFKIYFKNQ